MSTALTEGTPGTFTVKGIAPYDGTYEVPADFTMGEFRDIKRIAGVTAGNLAQAGEDGDTDLIVALAYITLTRAGFAVQEKLLWAADPGSYVIPELNEEDEVGRPPANPTTGGEPNEPVVEEKPNGSTEHSGSPSHPSGGSLPDGPSLTGTPGSPGSVSGQQT